jgi:hypothetical protein
MLKNILLSILLAIITKMAFSQQDLTLYYMDRIPQANQLNPAFFPERKLNIGVPLLSSTYLSLSNSGFAYNDLDNIDNAIRNLAQRNFLTMNFKMELLSGGIRIKEKNYLSFNITEHFNSRLIYPGAMVLLAWEGNGGSLLGQRADMNGLGFDFNHYREYAVGYSRKLMDEKLSVGGRFKYLSGFQNFVTRRSELGVHTDEETHDITIDGAVEVSSSGFDAIRNGEIDPAKILLNAGNHGFGMDLGINYKITDEISINAAIQDFGFIRWNNDVRNFRQNDFRFEFRGFDLGSMITGDTARSSYQEVADTLRSIFNITDDTESYTTLLTSRFMIGGLYQFHEKHSAGTLLHGEIIKGYFRPAVTFSLNSKLGKWFSGSLSYSYYNSSFRNVGIGLSFNGGPFQFYIVSDNGLAPIVPFSIRNAHVRFGFNFTIGTND